MWGSVEVSDTPPYKMVCNIVRLLFVSTTDLDIDVYTRGMVKNNTYVYLNHLLAFDSCRPVEDLSRLVILPEIHSPLQASVWASELSGHPDKVYVKYILQGISEGFRIGFDRRQHISSASNNLHMDVPEVASHRVPPV